MARDRRRDERARAADPPPAAVARAHVRADGYTGVRLGQHLDGERSYVANFTVESGDELAAKANEYRERYGASVDAD